MTEKIADRDVAPKSSQLKGRRLFFGVCGSIGAVDSVRQIRELRRHGAEIWPVLTSHAEEFITPLSLEWAAERPALRALHAQAEHLDPCDGLIICPATWNSLVEISQGIASSPLTTIAAIQIGRQNPVLIVPTLNDEFKRHPLFHLTLDRLQSFPGVQLRWGPSEEGRSKMPEPEALAEWVIGIFSGK